jgi:hypothetical protein
MTSLVFITLAINSNKVVLQKQLKNEINKQNKLETIQ